MDPDCIRNFLNRAFFSQSFVGTATALGGFMGYRFLNSGKFMPAGLITLLSVGMVVRLSLVAFRGAGNVASEHYKK